MEQIRGKLVVSCQALPHEPLHSPFIMGRMALAAKEGGAAGIRANTVEDILEIRKNVDLPIIGIIKKDYPQCAVYITPTMDEVEALVKAGVEMIAMDATMNPRPDGLSLEEFFGMVRKKYPEQRFMADCSTVEEAVAADRLGFDCIGTTLVGYTDQSKGQRIESDDFAILRDILHKVSRPVIAEGNIDTPSKARRVLELGCYSVVVGSSITRPHLITRRFVEKIGQVDL